MWAEPAKKELPGTEEQREFALEILKRVLKHAKGGNWRTALRMEIQNLEESE